MTKTIVALYEDVYQAKKVVEELIDSGINREKLSLVMSDSEGKYARELESRGDTTTTTAEGAEVIAGAVTGAVAGGLLGGVGGLLIGLSALALPGVGPIVGAGPIVAGLAGAGVGAAAGGIVGALIGWGIPEEEAGYYAEGVRRGNILVAVETPEEDMDRIIGILNRYEPIDIQKRAALWREQEGWAGYDATSHPYTAAENDREQRGYRTATTGESFADYRDNFRQHHRATYRTTGRDFSHYEPAYQYGYNLAADERYAGHTWADIEPEVRRHWETNYQNKGAWAEFKDSVQYAWERMRHPEHEREHTK